MPSAQPLPQRLWWLDTGGNLATNPPTGTDELARFFDHQHDVMVVVPEFSQPELAVRRGLAGEVSFYPFQESLPLRAGNFGGLRTVGVQNPQIGALKQLS
jgi:hypothetical protein